MLQPGGGSRTVQELLAHGEVATTMITVHVLRMGGSPQPAGLVVQQFGATKQSLVNLRNQPLPEFRLDNPSVELPDLQARR